jgi:hypothetical protein
VRSSNVSSGNIIVHIISAFSWDEPNLIESWYVIFASITSAYLTTVMSVQLKVRLKRIGRMLYSGMFRRVALVRTDVSEKGSASIIRVTRICEQLATNVRCEEIQNSCLLN